MDVIGAVDIGGTKIALGIVSPAGEILASEAFPTQPHRDQTSGMARIISGLDRLLKETGSALAGIGIGCTGQVNPVTQSLGKNAFLPDWEGPRLISELRQHYQVPVELENDAVAAALAEAAWGAGRGLDTLLYITVSTGIGGALVTHGRAYAGTGGAHPEIGHHIIDPGGPVCYCGAHGCWESLASGKAMQAWYRDQLAESPDPDQTQPGESVTAESICLAAALGEPLAKSAIWREGYYLGTGLSNLINLFSPDAIILGGGVMKSLPLFQRQIEIAIRENCLLVPYAKVRLLPGGLGPNLGLAGAAQVWLQKHTIGPVA
jgi:glucokinase